MRRLVKTAPWVIALVGIAGCSGVQSALDSRGDAAAMIEKLIWVFLIVASTVWILVMLALLWSLVRPRRGQTTDPMMPQQDGTAAHVVGTATGLTAIIIVALTALSYLADQGLASIGRSDAVNIRITGHQWWWEVRYESPQPARVLTVANEIHVPVGRPVHLTLESTDVIHSFWVPSLAGKEDLIPGHTNELSFTAERPGIYRGQCAEFCGMQHAHMAMLVIAEPPPAFDAWWDAQLSPAADSNDPLSRQGRQVFLTSPCVSCHTIRGTLAGGKVAPDLTHFASRRTLAAGTLPMGHGSLTAWIADPQGIKPGANMPRPNLDPGQLHAVVSYLETLK